MADLTPYPAYKDSAIPWLGQIPAHWEVRKLRYVLTGVTERNRPDLPLLSVVREKGVILRDVSDADENHNFIPDDLSNYKVVRQGQFAMNKMKAWQGSYGVSMFDGIVSPAYFVFNLKGVEGAFFHTALRSSAYVPFFTQASDGVRIGQWDLSKARMREIPFFVPPADEQAAIARYLDAVDRRIRRYIRAKQKLIKLLEEQKQAIIHQAVTRGLDPTVPLKDAGVEWLGQVPAHWEVMTVRRLISFITSGSRGWAQYYSESGDLFIQSGNLGRFMALDLSRTQLVNVPQGVEGERTKIVRNDVLVCITGALTGNVVHVDTDLPLAFINQHVALLRPIITVVLPRFLAYFLHSPAGQAQFKVTEYGGTKQGLGLDDVRNVFVATPELTEQSQICRVIDERLQDTYSAIGRIKREIDLIREYRTRLIADVVTGQVDVRGAAASWAVEDVAVEESVLDEGWADDEAEDEMNDAVLEGEE